MLLFFFQTMANPEDKKTDDNIRLLSRQAEGSMRELSDPLGVLGRSVPDPAHALEFDTTKLDKAIESLTKLRDTVSSHQQETKARVAAVLETLHGQQLAAARKAFASFERGIENLIPKTDQDDLARKYELLVSIPRLETNSDLTTVADIRLRHYQGWGDGDYDYAGGTTHIKVSLPEDAEEVSIEETGAEIQDAEFHALMMKMIKNPTGANSKKASPQPKPMEEPLFKPSNNEVEVKGVKIVLASTGGNDPSYYLSLPGANMDKVRHRMEVRNGNRINLTPAGAQFFFERAQALAEKGKSAEDIFFELSQWVR